MSKKTRERLSRDLLEIHNEIQLLKGLIFRLHVTVDNYRSIAEGKFEELRTAIINMLSAKEEENE